MRIGFPFLLVFTVMLVLGCGGHHSGNPVESQTVESSQVQLDNQSNRYIWGMWKIHIPEDRSSVEIVPQRAVDLHMNAVRLLEETPCTNCLVIENLVAHGPNELLADLRLVHPYPGLHKFTGFDVRGTFITDGDFTFPESGKIVALGDEIPRLTNPDGYTHLFNPTDFPIGSPGPPALRYIPGKFSNSDDLSATLNPYLAYEVDAPRRMFAAGASHVRTAQLHVPDGPFEFGYAVDVCWQLVDGPVVDPVEDFPPDANCLEAYLVEIDITGEPNTDGSSTAPINVEVFDHQGLDTIESVTVEAPDLFGGEISLEYTATSVNGGFIYSGDISNDLMADEGEYPVLVRIADTENDQNLGVVDAWQMGSVEVKCGSECGWVRTWGGFYADMSEAVVIDHDGNIYVTGMFGDIVDFDPGEGIDIHEAKGGSNSFLCKYDPAGNYLWGRSWGGSTNICEAMAIDDSGYIYLTGRFLDTTDFDPGPGIDEHTAVGNMDVFLSKMDSSGDFYWTQTWGGPDEDEGHGVAVDGFGGVYAGGHFESTVDFDPTDNTDEHTSNGYGDVFLSIFNSDGTFQKALTWGGIEGDGALDVAADPAGFVYTTGGFGNEVDFDPTPGIDLIAADGDAPDVFLTQFDLSGNYNWTLSWGSHGGDAGSAVEIDPAGDIYVTGEYNNTVDFDPGPGIDEHTSKGSFDIFLSKLDSTGSFLWAAAWGGSSAGDRGTALAIDGPDYVYVAGFFEAGDVVDFDPGPGTDFRTSNGLTDCFLSKFDSSGNWQWARTWGEIGHDWATGVATDLNGNVVVSGWFSGFVDFDPGPDIELHWSEGTLDAFITRFRPDGYW